VEFFSIIALVDKATVDYAKLDDEIHKYAFIFVYLVYSFARFVTKSSLACFRFKPVHILAIVQLLNLFVWWYFSKNPPKNILYMLGFAFWFGLIGGLTFANTMI
jgi:hypothetical protein